MAIKPKLQALAAGYSLYSVAIWSAIGGVAYLSVAGFLWLQPLIGGALAALCAGGALLALATLPAAALVAARRRRRRRQAEVSAEVAVIRELLNDEVSGWIERNTVPTMLGALAAGALAGANPDVRRTLLATIEGLTENRRRD